MSSMSPVVLISLPNLPYLLGTFDTEKFRTWWRSAPFPDDLETIKKGLQIYGRTHLTIAQRKDGRWAVYRSKDYGIDWERSFLAASGETVYDIVMITYGWAVMNTSLGFYETVNAGTSWALVLGLPGGAPKAPAFYNIGGGDVLVCTDGRYIWRSTNIARSWTRVCDMQEIDHTPGWNYTYHYTGPSKACIAGACGRAFAAHGPFLIRSDDAGVAWSSINYWDMIPDAFSGYGDSARAPKSFFPPIPSPEVLCYRLWNIPQYIPEGGYNVTLCDLPKFLISQIVISSVDGPTGDQVTVLIKIDDLSPVFGFTELFSWSVISFSLSGFLNNYFKAIAQEYLVPSEHGDHLSAYDVSVLGANYNDRLVFSAQTRVDPITGKLIPSLKYSTDGGVTWTDLDLSKTKVGDPNGGGVIYGSMLDDNFAKLTWIAPKCNNQGRYDFIELRRRQCQSYEMDVMLSQTVPITEQNTELLDVILSKKQTATESLDSLLETTHPKPYSVDGLIQGGATKQYLMDGIVEGLVSKSQLIDTICSIDYSAQASLDAVLVARPTLIYKLDILLHEKKTHPYSLDTILVKNSINEILSKIAQETPQFLDIDVPGIPYSPMDSRKGGQ